MERSRGPVLVVEDDVETRLAYRTLLEHAGWQVTEAGNGEDALRLAGVARPSLVVVDISIPGVDGWETTRRLKSGERTQGVPVLLVTGHALDADRQRANALGCDGYLVKPIAPQELLDEVERLAASSAGPLMPGITDGGGDG
jgi:two-component system, cell cycle response regulator DivK